MAAKVVTYAVALAELTLAMVVFARTLHVGRTSALAAALLAPLLVFPFYGTGAIYPIAALAPHDVTFSPSHCSSPRPSCVLAAAGSYRICPMRRPFSY
jgi:hypothetical protein